jgi:hypothetical protein
MRVDLSPESETGTRVDLGPSDGSVLQFLFHSTAPRWADDHRGPGALQLTQPPGCHTSVSGGKTGFVRIRHSAGSFVTARAAEPICGACEPVLATATLAGGSCLRAADTGPGVQLHWRPAPWKKVYPISGQTPRWTL